MRHSKAEKAKTHERIVAIALRRFREEGLARIGIADLMKEAGLTVGGFYKHFNSRDALVAEAVGCALELWKRQVDAAVRGRNIQQSAGSMPLFTVTMKSNRSTNEKDRLSMAIHAASIVAGYPENDLSNVSFRWDQVTSGSICIIPDCPSRAATRC